MYLPETTVALLMLLTEHLVWLMLLLVCSKGLIIWKHVLAFFFGSQVCAKCRKKQKKSSSKVLCDSKKEGLEIDLDLLMGPVSGLLEHQALPLGTRWCEEQQ